MNSRTLNKLMKRPYELQKAMLRGGHVATRKPTETPLLVLMKRIPPRLRGEFRGIRLGHTLGYSGNGIVFANGHQLYRWLGGEESELLMSERLPSESRIMNSFRGPLTLEMLSSCCASSPSDELLIRNGLKNG